ncbi:hypothetical protein B0H11DRAFT_2229280 [Mycena galericulata]|nr:hypothetical protein B0H11DRAFT_2229280 [Mycena galericulata]
MPALRAFLLSATAASTLPFSRDCDTRARRSTLAHWARVAVIFGPTPVRWPSHLLRAPSPRPAPDPAVQVPRRVRDSVPPLTPTRANADKTHIVHLRENATKRARPRAESGVVFPAHAHTPASDSQRRAGCMAETRPSWTRIRIPSLPLDLSAACVLFAQHRCLRISHGTRQRRGDIGCMRAAAPDSHARGTCSIPHARAPPPAVLRHANAAPEHLQRINFAVGGLSVSCPRTLRAAAESWDGRLELQKVGQPEIVPVAWHRRGH